MNLIHELSAVLNRASAENGSNTPDFILASYLMDCLAAFDKSVNAREAWYGREKISPGGSLPNDAEKESGS